MTDYDVVVVGGGAAGLSAALVLGRARRSVLVVDSGHPRNAPADHMHGYLSRDGLPPTELLSIGRAEVSGYGGEFCHEEVTELESWGADGCGVRMASGRRVTARRLVVATGLRDELPDVAGLWERWGRDVLHCPYCHGYEVRTRRLGVLGRSADAIHYTQVVRQWADDVVFFLPAGMLSEPLHLQLSARGIGVVEGDVARVVVQDDQLCGVESADGTVTPRDALFVPPHLVPNNELLIGLGCEIDTHGWVVADRSGRTGVPGVWVAGNVVNPKAQVINAASEGSRAGMAINADLVDEEVRAAVRAVHERSA